MTPLLRALQVSFLSIAVLASSCSDDASDVANTIDAGPQSDAAVRLIDLLGTWNASTHVFTNNANAEESVDLIADGGETRMVVLAGGGARTFRTFNGVSDDFDAQLQIIDDILRFTSVEDPPRIWNWSFSLLGNTLTLEDVSQTFDFTMTGNNETSATEHIVFVLGE